MSNELTNYIAITVKSGCVSSQYQTNGKGTEIIVVPREHSELSGVFFRGKP